MPGSSTTPGRTDARASAPVRVAFRPVNSVGTQDKYPFAAQWLAYALPCRRFARTLAGTDARLGADAVRYTFIAVDFHHLLLAGFTGALTEALTPSQRARRHACS
jgi:hypothetical protein